MKIAIAFPDEGAWKRFGKEYQQNHFTLIVCTKVRDGDKRKVEIPQEYVPDVAGRHVVIVDDLVKTGTEIHQPFYT
jgi:phosphoribosylpyrophosphate synthetase